MNPNNLEEAIRHFQLALGIMAAKAFPQACRDTAYTLGCLLYDERRFAEARGSLATAHEAVEELRGEIRRETAIRELAKQNADLYARLVHCCLLEDDEKAAFRYAVAGKGRAFVDRLATAHFDLWAAGADDPELAEDLRQARELRQQIDNLLAQLDSAGPSTSDGTERRSPVDIRADLRALQEQDAAFWDNMARKYPALTATQRATALTAEEARDLAADLGATLVEYYKHANGWCAFVATPDDLHHVPLAEVNDELFSQMSRWLKWLESRRGLGPLSYSPLRRLHKAVIEPLRPYLQPGEAVVMAPFGELHLVPLSAAFRQSNGHRRYAADDYRLSFAPSLAALRVTLQQQVRRKDHPEGQRPARRLLGVAYPGLPGSERYLENAVPAAEAVARHFDQAMLLYEDAATPAAVLDHALGQDVIHLVCHGSFDSEYPEHSGLELSGGHLTVQRIITELRLAQTRLATLSACESGRVGVRQAEEHVGLVQAVMSAGAQAVVAGLWKVEAASTRDLFEAFYAGIRAGSSPADALGEAVREMRGSLGREHPYYWAAFQVSGLAHIAAESEQRIGSATG